MILTKYAHACVTLEVDGITLLLDPGSFEPRAAELLQHASAVLITHDHFDHIDVPAVCKALEDRSDLVVYGPESVTRSLLEAGGSSDQLAGRMVPVHGGEALQLGSVTVEVFEGEHASIHPAITVPRNIGYLIAGRVFHPGDSYLLPPFEIDMLLVPVSGPWVMLGETIAFVEAVKPKRSVLIHDAMLSEIGQSSAVTFLGESGVTGTPAFRLADGESLEV